MSIITGKIETVDDNTTSNQHQKRVATIVTDDGQKAFVEFRGPIMIKMIEALTQGDRVIVPVKYEGKTSKATGINFNNLVAQSIQKV